LNAVKSKYACGVRPACPNTKEYYTTWPNSLHMDDRERVY
jgi:hypothetical protein